MTDHADRFLVARLLRGDEDAFAEFFESSFGPLFRFALPRTGGDPDLAEELVQTTLVRAVRKLSTYRGEAALLTWLTTICRRTIATHYESQKRVPPMGDLSEELPEVRAALESIADDVTPESALRHRQVAQLVQLVLDRLPARYGDALEWKYIDGLTVVEIAGRLRIAPKAAESVLTRARVAFREAFQAAYGSSWAGQERTS
jgi:RNA polymerase sigma-70 factor (ECF subfamily)